MNFFKLILGCLFIFVGMYLALLTGTVTSFVMPGLGKIVIGTASGVGVGLLTSLIVGTLGVATGGVGIALGALGMAVIGGLLGGVGATTSGFGLQTVTYGLVSWVYWVPLILKESIFFLVSESKKRKSHQNWNT